MNNITDILRSIPVVRPDAEDTQAINRITETNDASEGITLSDMDAIREGRRYNGRISLKIPRTLHKELMESAKREGVTLRQFILYKLAR